MIKIRTLLTRFACLLCGRSTYVHVGINLTMQKLQELNKTHAVTDLYYFRVLLILQLCVLNPAY